MAIEALAWPSGPAATDAVDGATDFYTMGCLFTVSESAPCPGIRWRVPDTASVPTGGFFASLWEVSPDIRVAHQAITPTPGGDEDFLWSGGPVTLDPAKSYICQVFTHHYSVRTSGQGATWPVSTPSGIATATIGKLGTGGVDGIASSNFESYYYVSPLIGEDDEPPPPVSGAGQLALPPLALTGTAVLTFNTGAGSLALPPLTLTGAGNVLLNTAAGQLALPPLTLAGAGTVDNPAEPGAPHGFPMRAYAAALLDAVDGVRGFARKPVAAKVGDAWLKFTGMEHIAQGGWQAGWQVVILLPADELAADDWLVSHLEDIQDALAPALWIINVEIGTSADSPALLINCRE